LPWLRPDAKSQVTVLYEGQRVAGIANVVISTQIERALDPAWVAQQVTREIIDPVLAASPRTPAFRIWVNPAGPFEIGGPHGDTGLTGRKIIVDTYGGACPHGGGAFSGKDPSKVDRSAAYMARYIAKNIVAAKLARRCLVQIAYAIGVVDPVSVMIDTQGTARIADTALEAAVKKVFHLTPSGIIAALDLARPIYRKTATYGHFGRSDVDLNWERTDQVEALKRTLA
jgi:S-adenosylmethionine synthetase